MSGGLDGRRHPRGPQWQSGPGLPAGGGSGSSSTPPPCPHLVTVALAVAFVAAGCGMSRRGGQNEKPEHKATAERLRRATADEAAKSKAAREEATRRAQRIQPKRGK